MSRRHRHRAHRELLLPFHEVENDTSPEKREFLRTVHGNTDAEIEAWCEQRVFENDRYMVIARAFVANDLQPMVHLSIKRIDRIVIDDWRDLQEIKNMICGKERDAVQVFPKESNLHDTSNQYHLFVYMLEGHQMPFGYTGRNVMDIAEADTFGAKQRRLG